MNSSVIKNGNSEGRVVIGLIIFVLLTEISLRFFEDHLSGNIAHIFSIPEIAAHVDQYDPGQSIVFLGNSLTNNAINEKHIESILNNNTNHSIQTLKVTPDATALSDWFCIYRNQFQQLNQAPSHIIVGFAWGQLSDQYPINPTRLGGFFCSTDDISGLSETGLTKHQQLLRYLAGTASHVYVNREAIRNKILDTIIPNYQLISQQLNQSSNTRNQDSADNTKQPSYLLLTQLIQLIQESGTQIVLMAMPVINNYELDKNLLEITQQLNVPLLDMRHTANITTDMFKDSIHLNSTGSLRFSNQIAQSITQLSEGTLTFGEY